MLNKVVKYADVLLRPTKVIAPNGHQTISEYGTPDANGQLPATQRFVKVKTQIDATNWKEGYSWFDGLGRTFKSQSVDSSGDVFTETEYDTMSRPKKATNPYRTGDTKLWTETTFDQFGRVWKVTSPDNAVVESLYGLATSGANIGTTTTVKDQALKERRSITNALGQLTRIDEPTNSGLGAIGSPNQPTYYKYNIIGKMIEVTQGVQQRHFLYDSLGRLLRLRQPEQQVNSALNLSNAETANTQWTVGFTYDGNGNMLSVTDAKNVTTSIIYDNINRIKTRSYSNNLTPTVNFYYDASNVSNSKGKLTKVSSSISETRYTAFDNMGRLSSSEQTTDGQTYSSSYKYNLVGILTEQTYPSGRIVKNFIDGNGDISTISSKLSNSPFKMYAANFGYTASKIIKHLQLGNGLWESAILNSREQVTELKMGNSPTDGSLWKLTYSYGEFDANGNVDATKNSGNIAKQTVSAAGLSQSFVQTYKYDSLNRINEAKEMNNGNQTWKQTFDYDRYGNRNAFTQDIGGQQLAINNLTLPQVDANTNRFVSAQGYNYGYDGNGNLTTDAEGRQFTFDGDNKQTEVKNSSNTIAGRYFYDGYGKRVKKIEYDQYGAEKEIIVFVYDGVGKLVAEYSTAAPVSNPTTNYTATDPLGSPRVITNKQGQIISRRDFMPFGEQVPTDATYRTTSLKYNSDDKIRQKFTGYQRDEETQLDFAEARYYNSKHGRFTAVDPLLASGKSADPQTFNRYVYVMNQPLSHTDPTGLQAGGGPPRGPINVPSNPISPTRVDRSPITGPGVSDTPRNVLSERFRVEVSNSGYSEVAGANGTNFVAGRGTYLTIRVINEETGDLVRSMDFQPTSDGTVLPKRANTPPQDGFTPSGGIMTLPLCNAECSVVINNADDNEAYTPIDPSLENDISDVLITDTETTVTLRIPDALADEMEVKVVTSFIRDENNPAGVKVVQIGEATITTTRPPPEIQR